MNRRTLIIIWLILCALYFIADSNWHTMGLVSVIITKALPELLLLAAVVMNRKNLDRRKVVGPVCAALVFSVIGDTFGELKIGEYKDLAFTCQIAFFLFAQVCYCLSFWRHVPGREEIKKTVITDRGPVILKGLAALVIFAYLCWCNFSVLSGIDSPVFLALCRFYMLCIACTGFLSILQTRPEQWAFILGAMFFILSDSIIAINTFSQPLHFRFPVIMPTYFIAQFLLNITLVPKARKS